MNDYLTVSQCGTDRITNIVSAESKPDAVLAALAALPHTYYLASIEELGETHVIPNQPADLRSLPADRPLHSAPRQFDLLVYLGGASIVWFVIVATLLHTFG